MAHQWEEHIDSEMLEQYAMGKLPDTTSEVVEEHLLLCERCRQNLNEVDCFLVTIRGSLREEIVESRAHSVQ